jgi:hypothetical protein
MGFVLSGVDPATGMQLLVIPLLMALGLIVVVRIAEVRRTPAETACASAD